MEFFHSVQTAGVVLSAAGGTALIMGLVLILARHEGY
jgi:hypothetical protein